MITSHKTTAKGPFYSFLESTKRVEREFTKALQVLSVDKVGPSDN